MRETVDRDQIRRLPRAHLEVVDPEEPRITRRRVLQREARRRRQCVDLALQFEEMRLQQIALDRHVIDQCQHLVFARLGGHERLLVAIQQAGRAKRHHRHQRHDTGQDLLPVSRHRPRGLLPQRIGPRVDGITAEKSSDVGGKRAHVAIAARRIGGRRAADDRSHLRRHSA